ncbi:MAG: DUF3772 domain-containing protein [Pseudomonadota bacterium]
MSDRSWRRRGHIALCRAIGALSAGPTLPGKLLPKTLLPGRLLPGTLLLALVCALFLTPILSAPARAQTLAQEVERLVPVWSQVADAAEARLVNDGVPDSVLETLRHQLAEQRDAARTLSERASELATPLRAQLEALGPVSDEFGVEDAGIAQQRTALVTQLSRVEVPLRAAEAAFRRASDLVERIDARVRARFRSALLARSDSPLDPASWGVAAENVAERTQLAVRDAWLGMSRVRDLSRLAAAAGLVVLAIAILGWLRERVVSYFERRLAQLVAQGGQTLGLGTILYGLGLTVTAIIVPGLGVFALLSALPIAGLLNGAAAPLIRDLDQFAPCIIMAYWLSEALFGTDAPARSIFPMTPKMARRARRMTLLLGLVAGLDQVFVRGSSAAWRELETLAVGSFVLILVGSLALFRLARAVRLGRDTQPAPRAVDDEEDPRAALGQAVRGAMVQIGFLVALSAPVLAAFGYYAGARYLFFPTLFTAAMLGSCIVLIGLVSRSVDVIEARRGSQEVSRLALLPVLTGVALATVALPALALIWGARESDLNETWRRLIDGITIGETRISPADFLIFVAVFLAGYYITRLIQGLLRITVLPQTGIDTGAQKALSSIAGYIGITLAALLAISTAGLDLSSLAIVAGALSVGIGFGLQTIVSNFVSGLILLIERPIKEGDWVRVGDTEGTVRRISVRATAIQTFDRAIVTVPNADFITSSVMNRTHRATTGRVIVKVGVAYGSDTRNVERILMEAALPCEYLLPRSPPIVVFTGFGADALEFSVYCYLRDVNATLAATNDMHHRVAAALRDAGIEIPFAQRDLHLRNSDELARALAAHGATGVNPAAPAQNAPVQPDMPSAPVTLHKSTPEAAP